MYLNMVNIIQLNIMMNSYRRKGKFGSHIELSVVAIAIIVAKLSSSMNIVKGRKGKEQKQANLGNSK